MWWNVGEASNIMFEFDSWLLSRVLSIERNRSHRARYMEFWNFEFENLFRRCVQPLIGRVFRRCVQPLIGRMFRRCVQPLIGRMFRRCVQPLIGRMFRRCVQPLIGRMFRRCVQPLTGRMFRRCVQPLIGRMFRRCVQPLIVSSGALCCRSVVGRSVLSECRRALCVVGVSSGALCWRSVVGRSVLAECRRALCVVGVSSGALCWRSVVGRSVLAECRRALCVVGVSLSVLSERPTVRPLLSVLFSWPWFQPKQTRHCPPPRPPPPAFHARGWGGLTRSSPSCQHLWICLMISRLLSHWLSCACLTQQICGRQLSGVWWTSRRQKCALPCQRAPDHLEQGGTLKGCPGQGDVYSVHVLVYGPGHATTNCGLLQLSRSGTPRNQSQQVWTSILQLLIQRKYDFSNF